ncbi:MAG: hypothetical protein OEM82_05740 [Acidobacteriota bacterium]|nr:hypothetical protein [Acidobacteriota bacterium]MDH3528833.1 hypothetical protein [Acidobacteriota bacterium]
MKAIINKIIIFAVFLLCMAIGASAQSNDPKKPAPPKPKPPVIKPKPKPKPKPESSGGQINTNLAVISAKY